MDYFPGDDLLTPVQRRKGLPIGNLTSQFLANYFLNPFDHFVKEQLRVRGYLRYVDDFVLFANSKRQLREWLIEIECFLAGFRLSFHPTRCVIYPVAEGHPFLGQLVYPIKRFGDTRRLRRIPVENFFPPNDAEKEKLPCQLNAKQKIADTS